MSLLPSAADQAANEARTLAQQTERAQKLKIAGLQQTIKQLEAQVTALQAAAQLPEDVVALIQSGELEWVLMAADKAPWQKTLEAARNTLAAALEAPSQAATDAAFRMGAVGAPHNETERLLFEAYLKGHCWDCGDWDAAKGYYTDQSTRVMFAIWRDRAALVLPCIPVPPAVAQRNDGDRSAARGTEDSRS